MSRKWLLFPFCLSLLFIMTPLSRASLTLRVNESATRVLFEDQATRVLLSVENSLSRRVNAHIKLELIDTGGGIHATAERNEEIKPGSNTVAIPIAYGYPERRQPIRLKCFGTVCVTSNQVCGEVMS